MIVLNHKNIIIFIWCNAIIIIFAISPILRDYAEEQKLFFLPWGLAQALDKCLIFCTEASADTAAVKRTCFPESRLEVRLMKWANWFQSFLNTISHVKWKAATTFLMKWPDLPVQIVEEGKEIES